MAKTLIGLPVSSLDPKHGRLRSVQVPCPFFR